MSEATLPTQWHVRVNNGAEQTVTTTSDLYEDGALAAYFSLISAERTKPAETVIEIWVASLLPEYGPYKYVVFEDEDKVFIRTQGPN